MDSYLEFVGMALFLFMLPAFLRVVNGPTAIDRIVAVNIIGTKTTVILIIIGTLFHRVEMFVDLAITYALLNFIASLAAAKYLHKKRPREAIPILQSRRRMR